MPKNIKQTFDEIVAFQTENPEQNRSGCLYQQDAQGEILRNYIIQNEVFKKCIFSTSKLISCQFINCTFLECDFTATEFINCKFIQCTVNNSIFTNAILMDTQFKDCAKANNILDHLHCSGNTKGLNSKDQNIMQDEIVNQEDYDEQEKQDLKKVFSDKISRIMNDEFPQWTKESNGDDYPSFVYADRDNTIGITLYSDAEKNSTDTDNFWCLSIFFKNDSLLTSDFNLFGMEADNIISLIKNWTTEVLQKNAPIILQRIFEDLNNK